MGVASATPCSACLCAFALDKYRGTLVFVSHDREFVSSLATRILELKPGGAGAPATLVDYRGSYEDYLKTERAELALAVL